MNGPRALPSAPQVGDELQRDAGDALERLAAEARGVFLLKIDAQGHECTHTSGRKEYLLTPDRPVYYILIEYYPKGLKAGGVDPIDLLKLLQHELGYQCFDLRCDGSSRTALTFKELCESTRR